MVGPDWALFVLVAYPLVQIPLVLYMARWFELDGDAPIHTSTRAYWTGQVGGEGFERPATDRPGRCRRCGAENDPAFSFCRNCVASLA